MSRAGVPTKTTMETPSISDNRRGTLAFQLRLSRRVTVNF
jgi:hypothetical protein